MTGRPATLDELFGDDLSHQGTRYSATPERKIRCTVFGMSGRQDHDSRLGTHLLISGRIGATVRVALANAVTGNVGRVG